MALSQKAPFLPACLTEEASQGGTGAKPQGRGSPVDLGPETPGIFLVYSSSIRRLFIVSVPSVQAGSIGESYAPFPTADEAVPSMPGRQVVRWLGATRGYSMTQPSVPQVLDPIKHHSGQTTDWFRQPLRAAGPWNRDQRKHTTCGG